jgi:hypothetical protein
MEHQWTVQHHLPQIRQPGYPLVLILGKDWLGEAVGMIRICYSFHTGRPPSIYLAVRLGPARIMISSAPRLHLIPHLPLATSSEPTWNPERLLLIQI